MAALSLISVLEGAPSQPETGLVPNGCLFFESTLPHLDDPY
jgi:hypothetical protein